MTTLEPAIDRAAEKSGDDGTATHTEGDTVEHAALDTAIAELHEGSKLWARTSLSKRARLMGELLESIEREAANWVATAASVKLLDAASPYVGEEWISGPYATLDSVRVLRQTLRTLARGASPLDHTRFGTAPGGRVTVPVLPHGPHQKLLFHGFRADVWLTPGRSAAQASASAGLGQLTPSLPGGVGLVLGAGNITSIAPLDVIYELVANNRVTILKLNPTFNALLEVYRRALAPLIRRGLLRIVTGGAAVGGYLAQHPQIDHVHITGGRDTHDTIVWGPDADGRRTSGTPLLTKPITSELGGVSPIIVVPGAWTTRDLRYQAEHVVTQRLHNSGHNCVAGQTVVISRDWAQRDAFLAEIRTALGRVAAREPWYPGSGERMSAAAASYPDAETIDGRLLLEGDGPDMLKTEYFAPVLGVLELAGTGQRFIDAAIDAANDDFAGDLGVNIIISPTTLAGMTGFDESLARLRYGTVAVNAWTGMAFLTAAAPWGGWRGHTIDDVQSGIGVVHNSLLLADTERVVVRGPFREFPRSIAGGELALFPKPPWFVTARSAAVTGRLLTTFGARPAWLRLPAIFAAAFRA